MTKAQVLEAIKNLKIEEDCVFDGITIDEYSCKIIVEVSGIVAKQ